MKIREKKREKKLSRMANTQKFSTMSLILVFSYPKKINAISAPLMRTVMTTVKRKYKLSTTRT